MNRKEIIEKGYNRDDMLDLKQIEDKNESARNRPSQAKMKPKQA